MKLKVEVEVATIGQLITLSGATISDISQRMGVSPASAGQKLRGSRSLFLDEVGAIVGAINSFKRTTVTEDQVVELIGKHNIRVRGFAT